MKLKTESLNSAEASWLGGVAIDVTVRDLPPFRTDEPKVRGGTNTGPAPVEYLMGAYAGCVIAILHMIAADMKFTFETLRVHADGNLDPRGIAGLEGFEPKFHWIKLQIHMATTESADRLETLKAQLSKRCPIYHQFVKAGIPIEETWHVSSAG